MAHVVGVVEWPRLRLVLVALAVGAAGLETVRLGLGYEWALFDHLAREYERDNPAGYALYAWSMAAVGVVFRPVVALPGMFMLALADPISGLLGDGGVGEWKSPAVVAATFGVSVLLAAGFTVPTAGWVTGGLAAAVGGAGAAVADGYKLRVRGYVIDDNATIAPAASVGIWAVLAVA